MKRIFWEENPSIMSKLFLVNLGGSREGVEGGGGGGIYLLNLLNVRIMLKNFLKKKQNQ